MGIFHEGGKLAVYRGEIDFVLMSQMAISLHLHITEKSHIIT